MPWEIKVLLIWGFKKIIIVLLYFLIMQHYLMQLTPRLGDPGQVK